MIDRTQLKQEEVVGDSVVLNDINPKTNTKSIDDINSGVPLDVTLDRMWNAINNKLSRIVNSVNGRTGVVVLNSDDVGLGNVDNVSLADIKNWVINRMQQEFNNKRISLFDTLDDVDRQIQEWGDDEVYADKPFYSHHGYQDKNGKNDLRGYIGYIYWDPNDERLKQTHMVIDTVGWSDNSIIYNEDVDYNSDGVENIEYGNTGGIGVNIWKYEDALEVYHRLSGTKSNGGLRIKKEKLSQMVHFFDGVYGNGDPNDTSALLYFDSPTEIATAKTVVIKIDGKTITMGYNANSDNEFVEPNYIRQKLSLYDIVICNFNDKNYITKTPIGDRYVINGKMNPGLILRQTCIGQVTQAPTMEHPEYNYTIEFYTLRPNISAGLKTYTVKDFDGTLMNPLHESIGISLLTTNELRKNDGIREYNIDFTENKKDIGISGLNAFMPFDTNAQPRTTVNSDKREFYTITPTGLSYNTFEKDTEAGITSGMYILPNYSLCVIPYKANKNNNNHVIPNWPMSAPTLPTDPYIGQDKVESTTSMLGINLEKFIKNPADDGNGDYTMNYGYAVNMSGLRINTDKDTLYGEWFGDPDFDTAIVRDMHSGGLSVNVGDFLEIGVSGLLTKDRSADPKESFYDEGKVNVRINEDKGIISDGSNKLSVRLSEIKSWDSGMYDHLYLGGCLTFTNGLNPNGTTGPVITPGITLKRGLGLRMSSYDFLGADKGKPDSLAVSIFDTKYTYEDSDNGSEQLDFAKGMYGGLRYLLSGTAGNNVSAIGVRVNELNNNYGPDTQIGSRGIGIDRKTNVLSVQLYKRPDYVNLLAVKDIEDYIEDKYGDKIFLPSPTVYFDKMSKFPEHGEEDRVYVFQEKGGKKKRFIWNETTQEYEPMYIFLNTKYDLPDEGEINKIYVCGKYDTVELYSWGDWCKILFPDLNDDDVVNLHEVSLVMQHYTNISTGGEGILTDEQLKRADILFDGSINSITASALQSFFAKTYQHIYPQSIIGWKNFIRDNYYNDSHPLVKQAYDADSTRKQNANRFVVLYSEEDVMTGLDFMYDKLSGLKEYSIEEIYDKYNSTENFYGEDHNNYRYRTNLGINIYDMTSVGPAYSFDKYRNGGLRFNKDGVLAIRVNKGYSLKYHSPLAIRYDDLTRGTYGLGIDKDNVLKVQIDKTRKDLDFDKHGNLIISDDFTRPLKPLMIKDLINDTSVTYDGLAPTTIVLGPGLELVDVPDEDEDYSDLMGEVGQFSIIKLLTFIRAIAESGFYDTTFVDEITFPDVNGAGVINNATAETIMDIYTKQASNTPLTDYTEEQIALADVDKNGAVNSNDATYVETFISKCEDLTYTNNIVGWKEFANEVISIFEHHMYTPNTFSELISNLNTALKVSNDPTEPFDASDYIREAIDFDDSSYSGGYKLKYNQAENIIGELILDKLTDEELSESIDIIAPQLEDRERSSFAKYMINEASIDDLTDLYDEYSWKFE